MRRGTVTVIGAGVGGITAAIHLARRGLQVTVVEKNLRPGGRCGRFEWEGHRFDTGPTLFVMPRLYESEFRALGTCLDEQLDLQRVDPTYHLVFDNGSQLALTSDAGALRRQLESVEPGSFDHLQHYLEEGEQHYGLIVDRLINCDFRRMSDILRPRMLALPWRLRAFTNHYGNMSRYFDDPRLKAAFTFQDIYMGLSPFHAPATYSLMPYTELAHGVWYPKGGMYSVVEALFRLAEEAGVRFRLGEAVKSIAISRGRATGVILAGGARIDADVVLANADLPYAYQELLPRDSRALRISRKQFSCSVISFFWAVDSSYPSLGPHTLFLADDYRQNFESIMEGLDLPANPSLYIHAPARVDPSMTPSGQDTLIAIVPVGHLNGKGDQDWNLRTDRARQHVFRKLGSIGLADIEHHIKKEWVFTPPIWKERYNLVRGSTHGLSHTLSQMACFRPSNRHPSYRNVYFVGASTHPGTGLPTAMVSGRLVATRIMDEIWGSETPPAR